MENAELDLSGARSAIRYHLGEIRSIVGDCKLSVEVEQEIKAAHSAMRVIAKTRGMQELLRRDFGEMSVSQLLKVEGTLSQSTMEDKGGEMYDAMGTLVEVLQGTIKPKGQRGDLIDVTPGEGEQ